ARGDDGLPLAGVLAALLEERGGGVESGGHRLDRGRCVRRVRHRTDELLLERARTAEQDLALVDEVPEERSLGQARSLGDLRHRGVVESVLGVERESRLLETATRIRFPSSHSPSLVMSAPVIGCYGD